MNVPQKKLPSITTELAQEIVNYFVFIVPEDWKEVGTGTQRQTVASLGFPKNFKIPVDLKLYIIEQALAQINPDDSYFNWIKARIGLHYQFWGSEEGLGIWGSWSSKWPKYYHG